MAKRLEKSEEEYINLASSYFQENEFSKAEKILLKAIKEYPRGAEFYYNLGLIWADRGIYNKAIALYKKAANLAPLFELAHLNLGVIYIRDNQLDLGIKSFRKLLRANPHSWTAYYNLGLAMQKKSNTKEAFEMFRQALNINPGSAETYFQLGLLTLNTGKVEAAAHYFKHALKINPSFALAKAGLGEAYEKLGRFEESQQELDKALKENPEIMPDVSVSLYYLSHRTCNWARVRTDTKRMHALTLSQLKSGGIVDESPFINISRSDDLKFNLRLATNWSKFVEASVQLSKKDYTFSKPKGKHKIRIGYLSNDFRDHPIASQIVDLFKYHDRNSFAVYAYSYGVNDKSYWRKEIRRSADHFIDLYDVEHIDIAERIYKDKIDILIDLVGYTGYPRPDIMARKPAPIQINYLGYPGTTGAKFINYLIADRIVIPPSEKKYYSEEILYMPNCYQICSPQRISRIPVKRSDFGLPEDPSVIVFCCFNRQEKIEPPIFDAWIRILKKVPKSVFWLYSNSQLAEKNLRKYFVKSGLKSNRLIFAERISLEKHLARIRLSDIALDTHIYSGGATTANILWAGVPVITIYGKHYLSRMSSSIINSLGLSELITKNIKEYEALAIELATSPAKLKSIRKALAANKKTYPLFNSKLFTKDLETIYKRVWKKYLKT